MSYEAVTHQIRLYLVSSDERLVRQCREAVTAHFNTLVELVRSDEQEPADLAGIYFIDLSLGKPQIALEKLDYRRCFAFIATQDLPRFTERLLASRLTVIVKPASDQRIRQVISQALKQNTERLDEASSHQAREADVMLQALLEANMTLQIQDQERTRFLARALHDFRTPLTSLSGYCSLLIESHLGPLTQLQAKVIERMQRTIVRLSHLTDGMFQLSLGSIALHPSERQVTDIGTCISQAVHELTPFFKHKNLDIRLQVSSAQHEINIHPTHIERVLVNLLDNAYKFSPRRGLIQIRAYPCYWERWEERRHASDNLVNRENKIQGEPNSFRIEIEDSGPGIRQDMLGHIFDEYLTLSSDDGRSGAGLGLAICKLIMDLHGGAIYAKSDGNGATFSIVLPFNVSGSQAAERVLDYVNSTDFKDAPLCL